MKSLTIAIVLLLFGISTICLSQNLKFKKVVIWTYPFKFGKLDLKSGIKNSERTFNKDGTVNNHSIYDDQTGSLWYRFSNVWGVKKRLISKTTIWSTELRKSTTNWIYDSAGLLIEENELDTKGKLVCKTFIAYDSLQRRAGEKKYSHDGKLIHKKEYSENGEEWVTHGPTGSLVEEKTIRQEEQADGISRTVKIASGTSNIIAVDSTFDKKGRAVKIIDYTSDKTTKLKYDSLGRLTKKFVGNNLSYSASKPNTLEEYTYDELGRLDIRRMYSFIGQSDELWGGEEALKDVLREKEEYSYDKNGLLISILKKNGLGEPEQLTKWNYEFFR